jgi:hypothetical protein
MASQRWQGATTVGAWLGHGGCPRRQGESEREHEEGPGKCGGEVEQGRGA